MFTLLWVKNFACARITHSYLLKEEQQPMYYAWQTAYTIKHVLFKCIELATTRETFYNASCMKELFKKKKKKTKMDAMMSFLKPVGPNGKTWRLKQWKI